MPRLATLVAACLSLCALIPAARAADAPRIRAIGATAPVLVHDPGQMLKVPSRTQLIRSINASQDQVLAANRPLRPEAAEPAAKQSGPEVMSDGSMDPIAKAMQQALASKLGSMRSQPEPIPAAPLDSTRQVETAVKRVKAPVTQVARASNFRSSRLFPLSTYQVQIRHAARTHGVDEALVRAVIHAESSYKANAVSRVGAGGLMQLMPKTAERFGVTNRFDAGQNIDGGTRYLAWLLDRYNGDVTLAAAAYNAGEGAVDKYKGVPPYRETIGYVHKVTGLLTQYRQLLGGQFDGAFTSAGRVLSAASYAKGVRMISSGF